MKLNLFAACILALALAGVASAQNATPSAETGNRYTKAQLKELAHQARTPEQYKALAHYYGERQKNYLQLATQAKAEWEQRSRNAPHTFGKYPRPVDWARDLYENYMEKASKSETLQAKFTQLAEPNAPVRAE